MVWWGVSLAKFTHAKEEGMPFIQFVQEDFPDVAVLARTGQRIH
jgi:hypothetical protein